MPLILGSGDCALPVDDITGKILHLSGTHAQTRTSGAKVCSGRARGTDARGRPACGLGGHSGLNLSFFQATFSLPPSISLLSPTSRSLAPFLPFISFLCVFAYYLNVRRLPQEHITAASEAVIYSSTWCTLYT